MDYSAVGEPQVPGQPQAPQQQEQNQTLEQQQQQYYEQQQQTLNEYQNQQYLDPQAQQNQAYYAYYAQNQQYYPQPTETSETYQYYQPEYGNPNSNLQAWPSHGYGQPDQANLQANQANLQANQPNLQGNQANQPNLQAAAALVGLAELSQMAAMAQGMNHAAGSSMNQVGGDFSQMSPYREPPWKSGAFVQGSVPRPPGVGYGHRPFGPGGRPPFRGGFTGDGGGRRGGAAPYRGGGRRGGGPFNHYAPRPEGVAPPTFPNFGRGRGHPNFSRGGTLNFARGGAPPSIAQGRGRFIGEKGKRASQTPAQPQIFPCDICKVECNSQEILNQHLSGKKHKKNLQKLQNDIQTQSAPTSLSQPSIPGSQILISESGPPISDSQPRPSLEGSQPSITEPSFQIENNPSNLQETQQEIMKNGNETEKPLGESVPTEQLVTSVEQPVGSAEQLPSEKAEPLNTDAKKPESNSANARPFRRGNFKRHNPRFNPDMRKAKRQKHSKKAETIREQPKVCSLCNVTCDTQAVFEVHLAGKRHMSRVKRLQAQDLFRNQGQHSGAPPQASQAVSLNPPVLPAQVNQAGSAEAQQVIFSQPQQVVSDPQIQQAVSKQSPAQGGEVVLESQTQQVSSVVLGEQTHLAALDPPTQKVVVENQTKQMVSDANGQTRDQVQQALNEKRGPSEVSNGEKASLGVENSVVSIEASTPGVDVKVGETSKAGNGEAGIRDIEVE
ncbi:hypothetical protein AMTRI_Chr13g83860 [Amborella trichopoda]